MGLGVWFSEDLIHILQGLGEGVRLLADQRGLQDATDVAYLAGYGAALRAMAVSLGLVEFGMRNAEGQQTQERVDFG